MTTVYEDFKIYGPYVSKKDKRLRLVLVHKITKQRKSLSYPKYLIELSLNRYLTDDETVDHIDGNFMNNNLDNLQILSRKYHSKIHAVTNEDLTVTCVMCNKKFTIPGNKISDRHRTKTHRGYFCSKICTGKYGKSVQNTGKLLPEIQKEDITKSKIKN